MSVRAAWLVDGALSIGSGIWTMHFVGMLAFHLPVFYYWPTVVAALVNAIMDSAAALYIVKIASRGNLSQVIHVEIREQVPMARLWRAILAKPFAFDLGHGVVGERVLPRKSGSL